MDKHSNSIELVQTNSPHLFQIKFLLNSKPINIGKLDVTGEGTLILHKKKEHIFNKMNAIGINYYLLTDERLKYKWIKIFCGNKEYISTREYFLIKGKNFQFGRYELQSFISLSELNISTIRKFETDKNRQGYLFDTFS